MRIMPTSKNTASQKADSVWRRVMGKKVSTALLVALLALGAVCPSVRPVLAQSGTLAPLGRAQYFADDGSPLAAGKLYTYAAGTTTPAATYTDSTLSTANSNPIILDSAGRASIFLAAASYKFVLKTSADVTLWTQDNVASIGLTQGGAYAVFVFGGSAATPITATSYPSGTTWDKCHAETGWYVIDSANIAPGTYRLSGQLLSSGGVNTVTAALVNLSDLADATPLVTIASTSATGTNVISGDITFATGGSTKNYAIKVKTSAGTGYAWDILLVKVA